MTTFSLFAFAVLLYMRGYSMPFQLAQRQSSAAFYGFLGEHLAGTEDVRANGAAPSVLLRFYHVLRQSSPIYDRALVSSRTMGVVSLFLFVCGSALAVGVGAYLWSLHLISVGTVYLLFAYTDQLSQPIQQIQIQLQDLQQAEACSSASKPCCTLFPRFPMALAFPLPAGRARGAA